jgi:hypothetical protein
VIVDHALAVFIDEPSTLPGQEIESRSEGRRKTFAVVAPPAQSLTAMRGA